MDAKFKRSRFTLQTAKRLVTEASHLLQNAYMMDEFAPGSKLDNRVFKLHREAWQIREKLIDLIAVLDAEEGNKDEAYTDDFIQSERYELGLMSEEEEKDYVWKEEQKEPF